MQSQLQAVLTDLDRGTASPAYRALLKTNNNLDSVRQVFTDIINGSAVLTSTSDPQNSTLWSPPVLACADADEPFLCLMLSHCKRPTPAAIGCPAASQGHRRLPHLLDLAPHRAKGGLFVGSQMVIC